LDFAADLRRAAPRNDVRLLGRDRTGMRCAVGPVLAGFIVRASAIAEANALPTSRAGAAAIATSVRPGDSESAAPR
jgi:hypothetical protein